MSDSDETVCNESGEENIQNSPSILSNWPQEQTNFSKETEKLLKNDTVENEVDSRPEISPEFPLITRGVKRKENFDETNNAMCNTKNKQCETRSSETDETKRRGCSAEPEVNLTQCLTPKEDENLNILVTGVENFVKRVETTSKDGKCTTGILQEAKSQLADVQKSLVECNRHNQAKRKRLLSDGKSSQEINDETKLAVLKLAEKQKHLLAAFKKYKNLVQRLKTIASQRTIENTLDLSTNTGEQYSSDLTQNSRTRIETSKNGEKSNTHNSISTTNFAPNSITITNLVRSSMSTPNTEKTQILHQNLSNLPKSTTTTVTENNSSGLPRKFTQQGSVKSTFGRSQIPLAKTQCQNIGNYVISLSKRNQNTLEKANSCASTLRETQFLINRSSSQTTTQALANKSLTSQVPTQLHCIPASTNLPNSLPSKAVQSQQRQNVAPKSRLSDTTGYSNTQSNTLSEEQRVRQTAQLSLDTLVKKGVLNPGENVLTATSEGKLFSASLSDRGTILSAGGESFTSPRSWLKAICGSKRKLKNEQAWKMVSYKNEPLFEHARKISSKPTASTQNSAVLHSFENKITLKPNLVNSTASLKILLKNCRVTRISKEEVLSSENLSEDFWSKAELNDDILKALDF